jgi:hypothetical protein
MCQCNTNYTKFGLEEYKNKNKKVAGGGGRGSEICILGNIPAETAIFQIGSRDIRQQSGGSARVAKPRNGNATKDRIVRRARNILCKGKEARRKHLEV